MIAMMTDSKMWLWVYSNGTIFEKDDSVDREIHKESYKRIFAYLYRYAWK